MTLVRVSGEGYKSMTLDDYFELPHQDRKLVEHMFPNRPLATEGSESSSPVSRTSSRRSKTPSPTKWRPPGVNKKNWKKVLTSIAAAQKILDAVVKENQANVGTSSEGDIVESGSSHHNSRDGSHPDNSSSHDGSSDGIPLDDGSTHDSPSDEFPVEDSPSHVSPADDGPNTTWEKRDGISLSTFAPVIPQGVLDDQLGKIFPLTKYSIPKGLRNVGVRCYRLSMLQCLFHTPEMYHLLGIVHKDCERKPEECVTCAFQQLMQHYWNGDRNTTNELDNDSATLELALKKNVTTNGFIQKNQQDDPYEMMMTLALWLQWDAFGPNPKSGFYELDEIDDDSLVCRAFDFKLENRWTCKVCRKKYPKRAFYMTGIDLAVWEARASGESLESYLEDPRSNPFQEKVQAKCDSESCKEKHVASGYETPMQMMKRRILRAPDVLTIRLQRFQSHWTQIGYYEEGKLKTYFSDKPTKVNQVIAYADILDLTKYSAYEEGSIRYQLRGVVTHIGETVGFGHCTAGVARRAPIGTYSTINDNMVTPPSQDSGALLEQTEGTPYVLVYSRIKDE